MRHSLYWLLPGLLAAGACTKDADTGDTIPSAEGAVQPAGDGTSVSPAEACAAVVSAQDDVRVRLGCDAVELECPEYVMPAGSTACVTIDGGSVDACVEVIEDYRDCDDFTSRPCILTTIESEECAAGGAGGSSGGREGVGGTPSEAGGGGAGGATS